MLSAVVVPDAEHGRPTALNDGCKLSDCGVDGAGDAVEIMQAQLLAKIAAAGWRNDGAIAKDHWVMHRGARGLAIMVGGDTYG